MKNCVHCNNPCPDDASFCTSCGAKFEPIENQYSLPFAVQTIKSAGKSSLFLAAVILYTVFVALNFILKLAGGELSLEITEILTVVALWLIRSVCLNDFSNKTTGFTIIRVLQIIYIVLVCLVAVLLLLATLIAVPMVAAENIGLSIFAAVALIFLLAILVFYIIYSIMIVKSVDALREIIATGYTTKKISAFAGVVTIISGASQVVSAFATFILQDVLYWFSQQLIYYSDSLPENFDISVFEGVNAFSILLSLTSAASIIIFGILLLQCRKKLKNPYNA